MNVLIINDTFVIILNKYRITDIIDIQVKNNKIKVATEEKNLIKTFPKHIKQIIITDKKEFEKADKGIYILIRRNQ